MEITAQKIETKNTTMAPGDAVWFTVGVVVGITAMSALINAIS